MSLGEHPDQIVAESGDPALGKHPTWERVRLSAIARITNGLPFDSQKFNKVGDGVPLLRIRDVGQDETATFYSGEVAGDAWVEPGDLVVGMDGDFRIAEWRGQKAALNQRVCRIDIKNDQHYDRRLLLYALPAYLDAIEARTSSVTVKHLSSKTIADIPLPLPPVAEQHRIVEAIEEQFSRLDAGVASLRRAQRNLGRLRAAILFAAFDGPCEVVTLGEVAEWGSGGTPRAGRAEFYDGDIPWAVSGDLPDGPLSETTRKITAAGLAASSAKWVPTGAVLVAMYGATIGKLGVTRQPMTTNQAIAFAVPKSDRLVTPYLFWFLRSARRTLVAAGKGAAQPNISQTILRAFPIPLPSIDEQKRVVDEIDRRLSILDSMEATVTAGLARAERLRQSILREAFAGRLVPQDSDDESASALLERIAAERTTA